MYFPGLTLRITLPVFVILNLIFRKVKPWEIFTMCVFLSFRLILRLAATSLISLRIFLASSFSRTSRMKSSLNLVYAFTRFTVLMY